MIDVDTIHFIHMLNELAEKTASEFIPFSKCFENDQSSIIYNDRAASIESDETLKTASFPIVRNTCLAPEHHDIIDYYGEDFEDVAVMYVEAEVKIDDEIIKDVYVEVTGPDDLYIMIKDGKWTVM